MPRPAHYEIEAVCPCSPQGKKTLFISEDTIRDALTRGPEFRYYELRGDPDNTTTGSSVVEVLQNPLAIYEGVRDHQMGGVCVSGRPSQRWTNGGSKTPPPPDRVFCVYVSPGGFIYTWRWSEAEEDGDAEQVRRLVPRDHTRRFSERVWPDDG